MSNRPTHTHVGHTTVPRPTLKQLLEVGVIARSDARKYKSLVGLAIIVDGKATAIIRDGGNDEKNIETVAKEMRDINSVDLNSFRRGNSDRLDKWLKKLPSSGKVGAWHPVEEKKVDLPIGGGPLGRYVTISITMSDSSSGNQAGGYATTVQRYYIRKTMKNEHGRIVQPIVIEQHWR